MSEDRLIDPGRVSDRCGVDISFIESPRYGTSRKQVWRDGDEDVI